MKMNCIDIELITRDIFDNNDISIHDEDFDKIKIMELINNIYCHAYDLQENDAILLENLKQTILTILDKKLCVESPNYNSSELLLLESKIKYLETIPQPEQRTPEWYVFRNERLTASDLLYAIDCSSKKRAEIIKKKCGYNPPFTPGQAILHGIKYEPIATEIYEGRNDLIIMEFGCLPHQHIPFFGASPDGIVSYDSNNKNYIGRMLEIKCPKSRIITGIIPDSYYAQIQGQLEVCDLEYCDFLECDIKEYSDKNAFFKDSPDGENVSCYLQANNNEKGIIIELYDTQQKKNTYIYCNQKFTSKEEFETWEEQEIDKILDQEHLEYLGTTFWYLKQYSCVLVDRNRKWFNKRYIKIKEFWDEVLQTRNSGVDYSQSEKKYNSYVPEELNFIN